MKRAVMAKDTEGTDAYVVIDEPIGGLKPAIYHCDYVLRVGDRAFFSRTKPFKKLLVVPASWVFKTAAEAKAYATRKGQLRWCVVNGRSGRPGDLEIIQAYVREGLRENFYGDGGRYRSCMLRVGAKEPEYTYGAATARRWGKREEPPRGSFRRDFARRRRPHGRTRGR